jgi:hypothetical protein
MHPFIFRSIMIKYTAFLLFASLAFLLTGCEFIGDIFSAGVYTGMFLVLFVIVIIVVIIVRLTKR